jgi:hypothetical protein
VNKDPSQAKYPCLPGINNVLGRAVDVRKITWPDVTDFVGNDVIFELDYCSTGAENAVGCMSREWSSDEFKYHIPHHVKVDEEIVGSEEHAFHFVESVKSITHEVSTTFGLSIAKGPVGAAGSAGFAKGIENKLEKKSTVQYAVIKEKYYDASLDLPNARLARNVVDDVLSLAKKATYNEDDYTDFFARHGTHVVTAVDVGGMYYVSAETDICKMEFTYRDTSNFNIGLEGITKGLTASPSLELQDEHIEFQEAYEMHTETKKQVVGGDRAEINGDTVGYDCWKKSIKSRPETIGLTLEPIWEVIFKSSSVPLSSGLKTSNNSRSVIRAHFDEAYEAYVKEDANREDTLYQPPCELSGGVNLSPGFATSLIVAIGMMAAKMTSAVLTE